jgi:hypothetical protein
MCVAVGATGSSGQEGRPGLPAVVERWNGTTWKLDMLQRPGVSLRAVACLTTKACVGVGQTTNGFDLAQAWNGRRWQAVQTALPSPTPDATAGPPYATLNSVSCSGPGACLGVGSYGEFSRPNPYSSMEDAYSMPLSEAGPLR